MGASHLLSLYNSTRASRTKRLTAACLHPFRRYGEGSNEQRKAAAGVVVEERAASTAEEFERVSSEVKDRIVKEKERQGVASQTTSEDEAEEAEECKTDSVKEPLGKGNFHKTADNH